jgi:ubiquinone biosynthesis protein
MSHQTPVAGTPTAETTEAMPPVEEVAGFEVFQERRPPGLLRRFLTTQRHLVGLAVGGAAAHLRGLPRRKRWGPRLLLLRLALLPFRPFASRKVTRLPFPVQLRRRLEALGPTYVKLGQILSLREDLLPRSVTDELKQLLDRLPALPYRRFVELLSRRLDRDALDLFAFIETRPLGSASIGQIHRARLATGEPVIIKMVKPGIRETIQRDVVLLHWLGRFLQLVLARYQPRRVIAEFCHYTLREVDLTLEADNADTFASNFASQPDIVFPRVYRSFSNQDVLVMEFLPGMTPADPRAQRLSAAERDRLVDLGAEAIICMLYRDGFFHADLHPSNLILLSGPRAGFIDLGMVGRFDEELRRTLLYYYYSLVMGDAVSAARYLASLADIDDASDPRGFQREVEEVCRRWRRSSTFEDFSMGRLIMESVAKGARYRMYFPVEMVLMVKAIVTFEAVGHQLKPGVDVAAVTKRHVTSVFLQQFSPVRIARESLRNAPELVDALVRAPLLVTQGLRALDQATRRQPGNPFLGLRGTLFGGFCIVSGSILIALGGPWMVGAALFLLGFILAVRKGS